MSNQTIIIGDVHGCLDELKELLDACAFLRGKDRCILAGDLIDRGPDSPGVVRFARDIGAEVIAGNHEVKLCRRQRHMMSMKMNPLYKNPMKPSEDQERTIEALDYSDISWLRFLPTYVSLPEFNINVVHAGVVNDVPIHEQTREVLTMIRYIDEKTDKMVPMEMPGFKQPAGSLYWADIYRGSTDIVYGHNVIDLVNPVITENDSGGRTYGIDQGCVFGGRLTALILDPDKPFERSFVQVQAKKAYKVYGGSVTE